MDYTALLEKFARWFASPLGVWQTFLVTISIVSAEFLFPGVDPHGFWVLYWLTVYSAVTQPALAFVARQADLRSSARDVILGHLESMVLEEIALDQRTFEEIKRLSQ